MPQQRKAFTLVELLTTIAIVAALLAIVVPMTMNYVTMAHRSADKQTLTVLNDALNRYKMQGGDISALTAGAPIGNILNKLQNPTSWGGVSHQFLQAGRTFLGSSIAVTGSGHQLRFTRYDTYDENFPNGEDAGGGEGGGGSGGGLPAWVCISDASEVAYSSDGVNWTITTIPHSGDWGTLVSAGGIIISNEWSSSAAVYSTDGGYSWTTFTLPWTASTIYMKELNGVVIATYGGSDQILRTDDGGTTWTTETLPIVDSWKEPTIIDGKFFLMGNTYCLTSTDGLSWSSASIGYSENWRVPVEAGGNIVSIGAGLSNNRAAYSSDGGASWNVVSLPSSGTWIGPVYTNSRFIAAKYGGNQTAYSTDGGATWTPVSVSTANWVPFVVNGTAFLVPWSGGSGRYSATGTSWSSTTYAESGYWSGYTYLNDTFAVLAGGNISAGSVFYSTNGSTWTPTGLAKKYVPVYGGGTFLLADLQGSGEIYYSTDNLSTLTPVNLPIGTSTWWSQPVYAE